MKFTSFIFATLVPLVLASSSCRCLPGDACWPSASTWSKLNSTVGGRLVATVPLGSPCHDPTYDAAACAALKSQWPVESTHYDTSSSVIARYFANASCDPFTTQSSPCLLGNYVSYAVNVSTSSDVAAAVTFAAKYNIRFIVRNTGHDFLGRSTGAGALAVWTHYLKEMTFTDNYRDAYYKGSAVTLGAGVQGFDILETSAAAGKIVVTGDCPTVGVAGGYTQGGGHSALSTQFGLAADQTLSMEVITASGACVTASRSQNSDLYWALSGGGAGNFGVVTSMTIKTYPDAQIGGATLFFAVASTTPDIFWQAVTKYYELLPAMIDGGFTVVHYITSTYFDISVVTGYNKTSAQVQAALAPFTAALASFGIPFSSAYTELAGYHDHFAHYLGPLPEGTLPAQSYQFGSRLMTRAAIKANNTAIQTVLRNITNSGIVVIGVTLDVSSPTKSGIVSNSVLPAWRETLVHTYLARPVSPSSPFADLDSVNSQMTNTIVPLLDSAIPNSYSYMNEGDFQEPNWKEVFYGANYAKLLTIKKKWDPNSLFYNLKGVNSEVWKVAANGRMCRA